MGRNLNDWLTSYMEYTDNTESAKIFHKWIGISAIASSLRRKVWFNFGRIPVFPNLFIILVAEPGLARKTQALSFGENLLTEIPGVVLSADAITVQALLDDIEGSTKTDLMPDSTTFTHASLTISSGEFESFLGDKKDNSKMIITLTDLFDCKQRPFKYRTKNSGTNVIPHPFLNLVAATTPTSIANSMPATAIGGGLTSRTIYIWAPGKEKKIAVPEIDNSIKELEKALIQDLSVIARIAGEYNYTTDSRAWWESFYQSYEELHPDRICKDPTFNGWYSRKPLFMLKLALICAASESNNTAITPNNFIRAKTLLEEAEKSMVNTFSSVGRSDITADTGAVRDLLKSYKNISERKLLQMVWRDIDARKFDNIIQTILRSGEAVRAFKGPDGQSGVWYQWRDN